jgi:hypothetical protein
MSVYPSVKRTSSSPPPIPGSAWASAMKTLSSARAAGVEANVTIDSKSRVPHWLVVQCEADSSPSCDARRVDAVSVRGSHAVFIRYEAPGSGDDGIARVRVIKGDVHDQKDILVQLRMTEQLLTLAITASRKTVEVVLPQQHQLQRVANHGSGDVVVEDSVLSTMGPCLSVAVLGSGDVFAETTEAVKVAALTLTSKGSGLLQASFSELRVSTLLVESYASGDITVFADAEGDAARVAVIAEGSGDTCLGWIAPISVNELEVEQVGSGDLSAGPRGSCHAAKLSVRGSGRLDVGGVQCGRVDVEVMGKGDVVVQATQSLAVEAYGSGHVEFSGRSPPSISSTGPGQLYPAAVESSYLPAACKRHKTPAIKSKYAALSSGVLVSAGPRTVGVELDSAESSSSVAVDSNAVGVMWGGMSQDKESLVPLAAVVFLVALVLRWFNNASRRAQEEQRRPLLGAQRRVYV